MDFIKKRKRVVFGVVAILAVVLVLIVQWHKREETAGAKETVSHFFAGYKEKNSEISKDVIGKMENEIFIFDEDSTIFTDNFTYEIEGAKKLENDWYEVNVVTSNVDFKSLFESAFQKVLDQYGVEGVYENFESILDEMVKNQEFGMREYEYSVAVKEIGDEYKIEMDSTLADSLTGGMNEYLNEYLEALANEEGE